MPGALVGNPIPEWLKPEGASVFDSAFTKAIRAIASAIGANDPQSQVVGMMAPMQAGVSESPIGKALGSVAEKFKGIRAYHGSPHDFDKFATSKIGTGEGAQAYGHGLYFAENEGTAKVYRDALGGDAIHFPGGTQKAFDRDTPEWVAQNNLNTFAASPDVDPYQAARSWIRKEIQNGTGRNTGRYDLNVQALKVLDEWEQAGAKAGPAGRMYEVNINAHPDQFLDWDKTVPADSTLRQKLSSEAKAALESATSAYQRNAAKDAMIAASNENLTGQGVYQSLARLKATPGAFPEIMVARPAGASEALNQAGVPGIKYLDQGSRSAGEGTRNFVVFDDSLVSVLKKYGVALPVIEGLRRKANANGGNVNRADIEQVMQ